MDSWSSKASCFDVSTWQMVLATLPVSFICQAEPTEVFRKSWEFVFILVEFKGIAISEDFWEVRDA